MKNKINYVFIGIVAALLFFIVFQQSRLQTVNSLKQEQIDELSKEKENLQKRVTTQLKELSALNKEIETLKKERKVVVQEKIKTKIRYENKINNVSLMSAWELDNFFADRLSKND